MKKIITPFALTILFSLAAMTLGAQISASLSIQIAPPELPVYTQPQCPGDGYLWTPGYWAYGDDGYYWVTGVWVYPPNSGLLWTPSYWAFSGGYYGWHSGYWGEHVGFYGGVNYGYGYGGSGFGGGRWEGNSFRYNTAIMNVDTRVIHNTYIDRSVVINVNNRSSFNGSGGTSARPSAQEQRAMTDRHVMPTSVQTAHHANASKDQNQLASVNHGHPNSGTEHAVKATPLQQENRAPKNSPQQVPVPMNRPVKSENPSQQQHRNPTMQHSPKQAAGPSQHHASPRAAQPKGEKKK